MRSTNSPSPAAGRTRARRARSARRRRRAGRSPDVLRIGLGVEPPRRRRREEELAGQALVEEVRQLAVPLGRLAAGEIEAAVPDLAAQRPAPLLEEVGRRLGEHAGADPARAVGGLDLGQVLEDELLEADHRVAGLLAGVAPELLADRGPAGERGAQRARGRLAAEGLDHRLGVAGGDVGHRAPLRPQVGGELGLVAHPVGVQRRRLPPPHQSKPLPLGV